MNSEDGQVYSVCKLQCCNIVKKIKIIPLVPRRNEMSRTDDKDKKYI